MTESFQNILRKIFISDDLVEFQGLSASSKALLLSCFINKNIDFAEKKYPIIVVCESFDIAEILIRDIFYFFGNKGIHFFPFWDVLPYDNFSPHKDLISKRFETLDSLINNKVNILVTTPNALMQKFLPRKTFKKNTLYLKNNLQECQNSVQKQLLISGYNMVDVVEDQGEFGFHGSILDIYPINMKKPVRIEFSEGKTILQMRPFDIQTQRTLDKKFSAIKVLPANEIIFDTDSVNFAKKKLSSLGKECSLEVKKYLKNILEKSEVFPGIESLSPLFYPKLESLFDYLPQKHVLIIDNKKNVEKRADNFFNEVFMEYELSTKQNKLSLEPQNLFLSNKEIKKRLANQVDVILNPKINNEIKGHSVYSLNFFNNQSLRSEFKETDATSALGHMINLINEWQKNKIPILLSAKNKTQGQYFSQVLGDLGIKTNLEYENSSPKIIEWIQWIEGFSIERFKNSIPIICGEVSEGFQKLDLKGKTSFVFLTEEEVFGEKTKRSRLQRKQIQHLAGSLDDLREGDYVVHLNYGIGIYKGLEKIITGSFQNEFMRIIFAQDESVFIPIENINLIQKYISVNNTNPKLSKLGEKNWKKIKKKVEKSVENIAQELSEIYAKRKISKGFSFKHDNKEIQKFELSFNFEPTPDQLEVINAVKADMESEVPMDRLVCGDAGFGKTEIAMRAAFKAVDQSKQVAVLVPTTILAQQHFETFTQRFENTPFIIDSISRFRTETEQKNIIKKIKERKIDIIIGTHRLLSKDVKFYDLGLLVIDEEQRFGVTHKEKIKSFRTNVDVLTLSATPIPRTLHMSMMGLRDLSIINTPPADRRAVRTRLIPFNDYIIQEAVSREIRRGGQVFIVHNKVESIYKFGTYLEKILPKIRIVIGHGQMRENQLEKVMLDFVEGHFDVLLSTTIIESGLDIPKANTIIINNSQNFGLSQLYQLRGRVGRSNVQAYAYLLVPPEKILRGIAHERLQVLQDLNDLGAGFKVASKDLEIRGAGNLLGSEQSGQIASIGLELYTQMINDAVKKQKQSKSELSLEDVKVNLYKIDQTIPESFIKKSSQRLSIYKAIGSLSSEEEIWDFRNGIEDRFGHLPESLSNILRNIEVKIWGQHFDAKSIEHKNEKLRIQFSNTSKINQNKLVKFLGRDNSNLIYSPDNSLILTNVAADMNSIIKRLKSLEEIFKDN
tara:strand:- start:1008 stop:4550 length:3543 start_codon:yes stop_codon:yes gene_type:complete